MCSSIVIAGHGGRASLELAIAAIGLHPACTTGRRFHERCFRHTNLPVSPPFNSRNRSRAIASFGAATVGMQARRHALNPT